MPDQKPMWTRCLGWFSVMWVTKLMISPVKKRIFCPKTTKFGPKLAFLVDMGQVMQVFSVPCWWVGWWLGPRGLYLARHLFTLYSCLMKIDKTRSINWFDHKLPYEYFWGIPGWDKCCASFLPSISYLISYIAIFLQTICAISHIAIFSHTICPISHIAIFSHKVWAIKWHR